MENPGEPTKLHFCTKLSGLLVIESHRDGPGAKADFKLPCHLHLAFVNDYRADS